MEPVSKEAGSAFSVHKKGGQVSPAAFKVAQLRRNWSPLLQRNKATLTTPKHQRVRSKGRARLRVKTARIGNDISHAVPHLLCITASSIRIDCTAALT